MDQPYEDFCGNNFPSCIAGKSARAFAKNHTPSLQCWFPERNLAVVTPSLSTAETYAKESMN